MYGILGEDDSDTGTLKTIVRRLAENPSLTVKTKSFDGCSKLLRKGAKQLQFFHREFHLTHFVVCHDAGGPDPQDKHDQVLEKVVRPSGLGEACCIVIPVQELEAWILVDIESVSNVIKSWRPDPIGNPENIPSPKEHLEKLSCGSNGKPRYYHAIHNERVAPHLNLATLENKCHSFRTLAKFVRKPAGD